MEVPLFRPVVTSRVAHKALDKKRMIPCDHVLLWWCMPGVWCAKRLVLPRVSWICVPLDRDWGSTAQTVLAAAWIQRRDVTNTFLCS